MTDAAKTKPATGRPGGRRRRIRAHPAAARAPSAVRGWRAPCSRFSWCSTAARDLRYALSSGEPPELGDVRRLGGAKNRAQRRRLARSRTATCASPARPTARARSSWTPRAPGSFTQLFRVLGTGDRLFVHRRENPLPAARAEADVFEGRLIRFDRLPLRRRDPRLLRQTRHRDALLRARMCSLARAGRARPGGGGLTLVDRGGDQVSLGERKQLAIELVKPDRSRSGCRTSRFPTEADARAAIADPRRRGDRRRAGLVKAGPVARGASSLLSSARRRRPSAGRCGALPRRAPAGGAGRAGRHRSARSRFATRARRSRPASRAVAAAGDGGRWFIRPAGGTERRGWPRATIAAVHTHRAGRDPRRTPTC